MATSIVQLKSLGITFNQSGANSHTAGKILTGISSTSKRILRVDAIQWGLNNLSSAGGAGSMSYIVSVARGSTDQYQADKTDNILCHQDTIRATDWFRKLGELQTYPPGILVWQPEITVSIESSGMIAALGLNLKIWARWVNVSETQMLAFQQFGIA